MFSLNVYKYKTFKIIKEKTRYVKIIELDITNQYFTPFDDHFFLNYDVKIKLTNIFIYLQYNSFQQTSLKIISMFQ